MPEQVITGVYFFLALVIWELVKIFLKKIADKSDPDNYMTVVACERHRAACRSNSKIGEQELEKSLGALSHEVAMLRIVLAVMLEYNESIPQDRKADLVKQLSGRFTH